MNGAAKYALQGTQEYFDSVLEAMRTSGTAERVVARDRILAARAAGKLEHWITSGRWTTRGSRVPGLVRSVAPKVRVWRASIQ